MKRKVYAFHPRSDSRGCDLLSGNRNLGTLPIEDPDLGSCDRVREIFQ
jgi:hypothetical protein